jgi:hypothetical protein
MPNNSIRNSSKIARKVIKKIANKVAKKLQINSKKIAKKITKKLRDCDFEHSFADWKRPSEIKPPLKIYKSSYVFFSFQMMSA